MSKFAKWFEAQHGKREKDGPIGSVVNMTDGELQDIAGLGVAAAAELHRREQWDARRESALYAWQVEK